MNYDLYKSHHLLKNAFAQSEHFRAIGTRHDNIKQRYENIVALA